MMVPIQVIRWYRMQCYDGTDSCAIVVPIRRYCHNIVLQEMGGKYENQYAAAMLGNMAQCKYAPGELVAVTLRFTTHEHNGQVYQDILVTDIEKAF